MPRLTIQRLMIGIASLGLLLGAALAIRPASRVEELNDPQQVTGWNSAGLILADGRKIPLPGILTIPSDSIALSNATDRGVEIRPDGRVIGLVKIHHWCGNDRVKYHIARVDLAKMMMFFKEGAIYPNPQIAADFSPIGRFSESGWHISEYYDFTMFLDEIIRQSATR